MNSIIAKVKSEYKIILGQRAHIVKNFDIESIEVIDYTSSHILEPEEWFRITDFSAQDYFIEQCSTDFSTASLNQIENTDYNAISCICISQGDQLQFQRISPALFVRKKTVLDYSGEPKIVEHRNQIEIRDTPDAIYIKSSNALIFKNIPKIKFIFPGIEMLHREATQPEVDSFLSNNFIKISDQYSTNQVGSQNRKRIADIGLKFNNLSKYKQKKLIAYAKEKAGIDIQGGAFSINSEADLKKLLYAMDQRYYFADIYDENRLANSIRIV